MEKTNREIRALLSSMAPARAAQAVRLVGLPPDEETAVLAVDVHGQSCLQAAQNSYLVSQLRPSPIPAYTVQNPYCCNQFAGCGC